MVRCRALLVAVLAMLAGCSNAPAAPADSLSGELVELAPGIVVAVELGAMRARVVDDAGLAVPGARVQLTGTDLFGTTDGDGRLRFLNVTPGVHTARVERVGFLVLEHQVQVNASQLVELNLHLLPSTSIQYRPHAHDLWRGRTEHTLLDGAFDYQQSRADSDVSTGPASPVVRTVAHPNRNESTSFALIPVPEEADGQPNIVFPGTQRIHVTISWDTMSSTLSTVGLAVAPPGESKPVPLSLKASGSTWSIPVGPAGIGPSDVGHQRFTFWDFYLYPGNEVAQPTQWEPGMVTGPFDVTITAFKGDAVPLEPEHRDFWGSRVRLTLLSGDESAYEEPSNPTGDRHRGRGHVLLPAGVLVPPGTDRLTINHTWTYRTAEGELGGTPADMPYVLTWRTADQHRHTTPLEEYRRAPGTSCGERCISYDVEVDSGWTDAYYQTRSLWAFLPSVAGYEDETEYRPDPRPKDHYLEIIAWRFE